jgi:RNA chaperone Hfq
MAFHNQTSFLNHVKNKKVDVQVATIAGTSINGKITSHDMFTVILNGTEGPHCQQNDLLDKFQKSKAIVNVNLIIGHALTGRVTAHDQYTVILNDSIMIYKNNISMVHDNIDEDVLVFKNSIAAITL